MVRIQPQLTWRLTFLTLFIPCLLSGQFKEVYPIGEDPDINVKPIQMDPGGILFEANPFVRFSLYNNMIEGLKENKNHVFGVYAAYLSPLRMFTSNSLPVETPSQRVMVATQHLFRLTNPQEDIQRFAGFMFGTGHYSNGQADCAFDETIPDGTAECEAVYATFTDDTELSDFLNRTSGNYSTNFTRIFGTYRIDHLKGKMNVKSHVFDLGTIIYQNRLFYFFDVGGFSEEDIKIYGRFRFQAGHEFMKVYDQTYRRFSIATRVEWIATPHPSVNPFRLDLRGNWYPLERLPQVGLFTTITAGHDNYNYRFLDSGFTLSLGITWDSFLPIEMRK